MHDIAFRQKLAEIEADLVSAARYGMPHLHSEIYQKIAALDLDADDVKAVLDTLCEVEEGKTANAANPNLMRTIALGTMLAAPLAAGAKFLMGQQSYNTGWQNLTARHGDILGQDPIRAKAIYDLLHQTSPNLAQNTPVAADLMRQMMSMPMVDVGTVGRLAQTGKDMRPREDGGMLETMQKGVSNAKTNVDLANTLFKGAAHFAIPVQHVAEDGTQCVFDWSTEPMKQAGITDAFSGSGSTMDQANNAFQLNQQAQGATLLPLDAVVRELMAKEMELSQRQQILAQQEAQMQQAMMQLQQMGGIYQDQTGVDPASGQVAPEPEPESGEGEEAPPMEGGEDEMPVVDEGPDDAQQQPDPEMDGDGPLPGGAGEGGDDHGGAGDEVGFEDESGAGADEEAIAAEGDDAAGDAIPGEEGAAEEAVDEDPAMVDDGNADPSGMNGFPGEMGQAEPVVMPGEAPDPNSPEGMEQLDGMADDAQANPPADESGESGVDGDDADDGDQEGEAGDAGAEGAEGAEDGAEGTEGTDDAEGAEESEGAEGAEGPIGLPSDDVAEMQDEAGLPEAADNTREGAEDGEEAEGGEGDDDGASAASGDDVEAAIDDDQDNDGDGQDLDGEDVEGSVEDEMDHHQGEGALPEGSPEDQVADEALAESLESQGEQPTPMPGGAPHEQGMDMGGEEPAMPPAEPPMPAEEPQPAGMSSQVVPGADGGQSLEVTVPLPPLRVSVKLGEMSAAAQAREEALASYHELMADLFRP